MYPSGGDSGAVSIEGDRHDNSFGLIADAGAGTGHVALDQHVRNVKDAAVEDRWTEPTRPITADGAVFDGGLGAVEDAGAAPGVVFSDDGILQGQRALVVDPAA